jgi:cell fate (sporulation/competence/biofilm development) regulator YlbF (YheA/YmcA/DUF963 family)
MKEILDKANELGIMLKSTEAFLEFSNIQERIDRDESSGILLQEYNSAAEKIQLKQQNGIPIEGFEQEQFRALTQKIIENPLLKDYLIKRDNYMGLLMLIHEAMNIGSGEQ